MIQWWARSLEISKISFQGRDTRTRIKGANKANKCEQCSGIPTQEDQANVFPKKQNFDINMNLIGWYDTQDASGGQNLKLKKDDSNCTDDSCTYTDHRTVQKYYTKKDGNWLFAFQPKYE